MNPDFISKCAEAAIDAGVAVVAPAGDEASEMEYYSPASLDKAIIVNAVDAEGDALPGSNAGFAMDASAPGARIRSAMPENSAAAGSGTGVAAAHAAGALALYLANDPSLDPAALSAIIEKSSRDTGLIGWDKTFGYGILDMGLKKTYSPEAASIRSRLFSGVEKYTTVAFMSNISFDESKYFPILEGTQDEQRQIAGIAGRFGEGRLMVLSSENHFIIEDGIKQNIAFRTNILSWLNEDPAYKRIGIPNSHGEALTQDTISKSLSSWASSNGMKFANISLTKSSLETVDSVILGNPSIQYEDSEIEALTDYVENGGSVLIVGSGWFWSQRFGDPQAVQMPLNILGRLLGYSINSNAIIDTASIGLAKY
jgi:hypothetical protein